MLGPIITVEQLGELEAVPVIADVRWYLDGSDGRAAYEAGHLPGAVFVDLDRWLSSPASPTEGRHPLPDPATFAEGMRSLGVDSGRPVIAYDDRAGGVAGRLVVMLRWLGHPAALLDGGLAAWPTELETGPSPTPEPGDFEERPWPTDRFVTADDVDAHLAAGGTVIDARAGDRFRGETEPMDSRAGHVPGAINRPFADNLDAEGRFLGLDALAERYADLGDSPIAYCGSGVSACNDLLVMEAVGIDDARLYVGSWSQWSADPDRAVATGE
ncbi:MAG: sulfurtransferase [Actinomycetota bacterium]